MLSLKYEEGHCIVCQEDAIVKKGQKAHVCRQCFDELREHVVWVCLNCEEHFYIEKEGILDNITDASFKKAFKESDRAITVIIINSCSICDPDDVIKFTKKVFGIKPKIWYY